jgi:hypothetical protein
MGAICANPPCQSTTQHVINDEGVEQVIHTLVNGRGEKFIEHHTIYPVDVERESDSVRLLPNDTPIHLLPRVIPSMCNLGDDTSWL